MALAVLAAALLGACAVASGTAAMRGPGMQVGRDSSGRGLLQYRDPDGWRLSYPSGMYRQRVHYIPPGAGEDWTKVVFANFPLPRGGMGSNVPYAPPLDRTGTFPATGVALEIYFLDLPQLPAADSRFPVRLAWFQPSLHRLLSPGQYPQGKPPLELDRIIVGDGIQYQASVLVGPSAPADWRRALRGVIASLRFPHLHPGLNPDGAYVLEPRSHYPIGSFTLVHPSRKSTYPFFVVHAPGRLPIARCTPARSCTPAAAFYALYWMIESGGNASRCNIQFDDRDDQFYCTNSAARWDRVGAVLRVPRGSPSRDPLPMTFLTVTWDGHLIMPPLGSGVGPLGRAALRILWPGWRGH